jgi:hypothetical protein
MFSKTNDKFCSQHWDPWTIELESSMTNRRKLWLTTLILLYSLIGINAKILVILFPILLWYEYIPPCLLHTISFNPVEIYIYLFCAILMFSFYSHREILYLFQHVNFNLSVFLANSVISDIENWCCIHNKYFSHPYKTQYCLILLSKHHIHLLSASSL